MAVSLCALLMGTPANAQKVTGSITGFVTDKSGAVVPGAQITAHDIDTGVDTSTTSNGDGLYRIDSLPIGQYQVMVEAKGFGSQTLPPFTLEVLQTATFNIKLEVGSSATTVNVSGAAPILNSDNPTIATTFTANQIANVPLNGLDFSALTLYVPGSVDTAGTSGTTSIERSTYFTDTPNMNGNRAQANNYTLDGIDMNETFNNLIAYSPAPDALQEIKVLTANSPTEYGNVNGGGVASVLKSGTNSFHGSAYGYVQDYKLNANSWTNNQAGKNAQGQPNDPINPFSQSQFGGSVGGPVLHDKLFFFVDYLGARYHRGGTSNFASVFTAAMRQGDFSALLTGANPVQLYDSENNFQPYVGNKGVPIINPVAKYLFAHPELYPLPNETPTDGIVNNDLSGPARHYSANNQGDIKIEYDLRASDKVTGFYSMSTAYDGQDALLAITFPGFDLFPTKIVGANWVHTFSPAILNSARVGFTRTTWANGLPSDPTGLFGLTGDQKVGITAPAQNYVGFANQGISGLSSVGTPAQGGGLIDNTYSYLDTLTWQRGRHLISAGLQATRYQNNYPTANNFGFLGSLNYSGAFTTNPNLSNAGGFGGADFELDRVSEANATLGSVNVGNRQWRTAGYVSDDYKTLPNLTLNFGIRYEFDEPWVEQNNKTGNVDLTTGQVIYAHSVPAGAAPGSGLCSNRACYDPNFRQIMPRLGFAYQASDKFVIRGGYGATSFFEGNSSNQRLTSITPFIQAVQISTLSPTTTSGGTPRTAEEGFSHTSADIALGGTYNVYPKKIQPAYVQEWNLTAEYAITRSTSLQAGYLGEQGQHIEDYGNVNQFTINNDPASAPLANNATFGTGSLLITESRAMMNFNAMESTLRQRASHGLEFTLNYTYSKAMTNSLGNYGLEVSNYSGAFQNYYDSAADYGPAGYDVKHNISGTGVYALPVGRGKDYFSNANRYVDEAVGGWKLAVAAVSYSGFPESLTYNGGNNSNSYGVSRPNQYEKLKVVHHSLTNWFGTDPSATPCTTPGLKTYTVGSTVGNCAFGVPAVNAFGTSRNGAVRGPGYLNVDMSAFKDFRIIREQSIGFRFDAFNAFNIVSYGNPDTNINDSTFGDVDNQSPRSVERRLQFSAHYSF
jgi:hypothetical protein